MEENEINHQLGTVENYLGSYAIDELNEIKVSNYPSFIVLNLDTRNGIGMHWIAWLYILTKFTFVILWVV